MVKNVSTGSNPPKNNTAGELVTETIPEMQVTSSSDLKGLSKDQKETFTKLCREIYGRRMLWCLDSP